MKIQHLVLASLAAFAVAASAHARPDNGHGGGGGGGAAKGRPVRKVVNLVNPGVDADAKGKLDVKYFPPVGKRAERSWLRVHVRKVEAGATYTLWMDDPATAEDFTLVQVADVTLVADDEGAANLRLDTKKGSTLPHGATLATLGGMALEIRDVGRVAVLTGTMPAVQ
jgi:hypothetical protein